MLKQIEIANFRVFGHVGVLLAGLATQACVLLVDDAGLFHHEFQQIVAPQFKRESEIAGEIAILRYWADPGNHSEREIANNRLLVNLIKTIIIETERMDRALVYIAFTNGRVLVSNDEAHIVTGPASKREKGTDRRDRLKKAAKKHIVDGAAILFSFEANACLENA